MSAPDPNLDPATAFDAAVRRVLPALNLDPATFTPPAGFVARALRFGEPRVLVLAGRLTQAVLVHVGTQPGAPRGAWPAAQARALAVLSTAAADRFDGLVVAWSDETGRAFAAASALAVVPGGADADPTPPVPPLGASWLAPSDWPRPTIDAALPRADVLADARAALALAVRDGDAARTETAWTLLGQALRRLGGEPLADAARPPADAETASRERWLAHVERAVGDELRRIGLAPAADAPSAVAGAAGPHVFVSYARPDAATLAWPVRDALIAAGARVWLDQEQPPSAQMLNHGLAQTIARCDVYLMGASDEFFERAGYAMQELAWALALAAEGRIGIIAVAERADVPLPQALQRWPRIDWDTLAPAERPQRLATALAAARQAAAQAGSTLQPLPPAAWRPRWARRIDPALAALRGRHAERLHEVESFDDPAALSPAQRARLAAHADGLGWSGRLADIGAGGADPMLRALRWRMGALAAAVMLLHRPPGTGHDEASLAADLGQLIDRPLPLLRWPAAIGWGAADLRLLLRWHAGLLRLLEEVLRRGLWRGLTTLDRATDQRWQRRVRDRRIQTLDALLALRQAGALGWAGEPPSWDRLFVELKRMLQPDADAWEPACPASIAFVLLQHRHTLAAALADLAWTAARRPGPLRATTTLAAAGGTLDVRLFAAGRRRPAPPPGGFAIGFEPAPGGSPRLAIAWSAGAGGAAAAATASCRWPAHAVHWTFASA